MHVAGKGYRVISKTLDVHQSTVRQIVYECRQYGIVALHGQKQIAMCI